MRLDPLKWLIKKAHNTSMLMDGLQIFLFGKFQIRCEEQSLITLDARKAQELFGYLLLHPTRHHFRDALADLLWGDTPTTQPKTYLRKAIWQLQTVIDTQIEMTGEPLLLIEADWIKLNVNAPYWLDVRVFEEAFTLVQNIRGKDLDHNQAQMLHQSVQFYVGDFMEGCYSDWCLLERERLKNMYLAMLDKLMYYHEFHQDYERGISYGIEALRHDSAREQTHWRLMRLYYLAGYRTEALRQFEQCETILYEELKVKPAKRTLELLEQIRSDQVVSLEALLSNTSLPMASLPPELLNYLQELQETLNNFHYQIQQHIQIVKRIINEE